jgi:NADPH:quinone reductase-like Zn-dependent oxidoreductase
VKAAVLDEFGDASRLQVRDVPVPVVGDGQILIRVHAASVNPIDWKMREGTMAMRYGEEFPMILGWDCSGDVVEVGAGVSNFSVGDEVFGRSDVVTGRCYAEYAALNTRTVVHKPAELSHVEAASIPMVGLTAINGFREGARMSDGARVLIVGASGGVGTLAVQIARNMGADHIVGVCSAKNIELVASLGVDEVIDYTQQNALDTEVPYDLVYDTVGVHNCEDARKALTAEGTYLTLVPVPGIDFFMPGQTEWEPGKGYFVAWAPTAADLQILVDWVQAGRLRPVIDSTYSLDDIRAAHERSQTERCVGKIVVEMDVS